MKCYREEEIMQYLDGEMNAQQALEFELHTGVCRRCRDLLNEYAVLIREFDAAELPEPAVDFTAAVMARLPAIDFARRRRSRTILYLTVLLLTLGVAALLYLPFYRDLGTVYDTLKACTGIGFSLLETAGAFMRTALLVVNVLLRGVAPFARLLAGSSPVVLALTGLLLFGEVVFIRYLLHADKEEYANE